MSQTRPSLRPEITASDLYGDYLPRSCVKCIERVQAWPWKTKLAVPSIVVALNLLLVVLLIRYVGYGSTRVVMSPGDVWLLSDNVDTTFCASQTLTSSSGNNFHAFVYSGDPPVNPQPDNFSLEYQLDVFPGEYTYWTYHLVPSYHRSNVSIRTCMIGSDILSEIDLYLIDGEDAFEHWVSDVNCGWCVKKHERYSFGSCDADRPYKDWPALRSFDFTEGMYIAYYNPLGHLSVPVSTRFDIEKHSYDTSGVPKFSCFDNTCSLELSYQSNDVVVVKIPVPSQTPNVTSETIISECVPRTSTYIAYFLCLPIGVLALVTALIICFKKINDNIIRTTENADNARVFRNIAHEESSERARLVSERDLALPPRVTVALDRMQRSPRRSDPPSGLTPPPSYQDIVEPGLPDRGRDESFGPPSYEDCMSK